MMAAMEASSAQQESSLGAALDPRQRIYRDPFNELVVFVVSAVGASIVAPVILLVVGAIAGSFDFIVFVVGVRGDRAGPDLRHRPAREAKPHEAAGWALLWGFSAAVLGAAFWELVFSRVDLGGRGWRAGPSCRQGGFSSPAARGA